MKALYKLGYNAGPNGTHEVWCVYFPRDETVPEDRMDFLGTPTEDALVEWAVYWQDRALDEDAECLVAPGLMQFFARVQSDGPPGMAYCLHCDGWYPRREVLDGVCDHCTPDLLEAM